MSDPLRILVITTAPQTMAAFFPRQLRMLAQAGLEVHAVSAPGEALDRLGPECGITTHALPMQRQVDPLRDLASLWNLYRLIRSIRPHVVHAHTPKAGLLGMAAARLAGVGVRLYTVHGLPLLTRTGMWRRILEAAERASAALSTRTYCVSHSVRRELVRLKLCPENKAFTLGAGTCAGINLDHFRPGPGRRATRATLGIPQDALLVTFIGRLAKDKGIGVLAAAWPEALRRYPNLRLLLAGEEDSTDPVPQEALDSLRQDPSVYWTGSIPAHSVPAIFDAADICVLPTFREGLSQVALESGAMGVPIVSSDVPGVTDPVLNGITGILVPPRQPALLADALCRLAGSPSLRLQMGQAGIAHVHANFADKHINGLWMAEYQNLIAALPGAPPRPRTRAKELTANVSPNCR